MPSSRVPRRPKEIIDNAQEIFRYTEGMDYVLRHEYDVVRDDRLFEIVRTDLAGLRPAGPEPELAFAGASNTPNAISP